ncbi:kinase-like protein [Agrocybe pediades]|nr:kinase-like protein [Agrocybe pediades]
MVTFDSLAYATTLYDSALDTGTVVESPKFTSDLHRNTRITRPYSIPPFFWGYLKSSPGTFLGEKKHDLVKERTYRGPKRIRLYLSKAHRTCTVGNKGNTKQLFIADTSTKRRSKLFSIKWDGRSLKSIAIMDESGGRTYVGGIRLEKGQILPLQDGDIISVETHKGKVHDYVYHHAPTRPPASTDVMYIDNFKLAQGASGIIKMASHKSDGNTYAIKHVKHTRESKESLEIHLAKEITALSNLNHPGINQIYEVYRTRNGFVSAIVLEYFPAIDLAQYLKAHGRLSEPESQCVSYQLCKALAVQYNNGLPKAKICDFGSCQVVTSPPTKATSFSGTLYYAAPEALWPNKYKKYTVVADSWSLGVTIFIMLSAVNPYYDANVYNIASPSRRLGLHIAHRALPAELSRMGRSFLWKLLTENPAMRMSAETALRHAWLVSYQETAPDASIETTYCPPTELTPTEIFSVPPSASKDRECPKVSQKFKPYLHCVTCRFVPSSRTMSQLKCTKCRKLTGRKLPKIHAKKRLRKGAKYRLHLI